ncbi:MULTISPECIES: hypothetical protein [Rhodococcus]|uniref:hypothetical protein n=1 Tax=Rhodococcus TaxID=1827 RepID=UPI001E3D41B0|nr:MULTISPECIES: hypothetical protein [Rhodococcus]BDB58965.1 hypothetical protein RDE2_07590 [Rhodococcus sp. RDE2]
MPDPATPESRTIRVQVAMDTDNLRKWAEWHADHGHADVAHALYRSAERYDDQVTALDRVRELTLIDGRPRVGTVPVTSIREALDGDS